jgi:Lyase
VKQRLNPAMKGLRAAIAAKAEEWKDIVKIGRTHMQDAGFCARLEAGVLSGASDRSHEGRCGQNCQTG